MRYKVRVYYINTNQVAYTVTEVFETKKAAEITIEGLESTYPGKYEYVKVPIRY